LYVISKRECEGQQGKIYTQLWAGYAASLAQKMKTDAPGKRVMVIDLGTGEFKRFICQIKHGEMVKLEHEPDKYKDKDGPKTLFGDKDGVSKLDEDGVLKTLVDKLHKEFKEEFLDGENPRSKVSKDIPEEEYITLLNKAVDAMIMVNGADGKRVPLWNAKEAENCEVHLIATSSTRMFFSRDPSEIGGDARDEVSMKKTHEFILQSINNYLVERYNRDMSVVQSESSSVEVEEGGGCVIGKSEVSNQKKKVAGVQYFILDHAEEAEYEFNAAAAALQHAMDLPSEVVSATSYECANLAWGSGSTQGFCYGKNKNKAEDSKRIAVQMGLNDVSSWVKEWMEENGAIKKAARKVEKNAIDIFEGDKEEGWKAEWVQLPPKKAGKEPDFYLLLEDGDACAELMTYVRTKIKTKLRESTSMGIKVFDTTREYLKE
jgi:hypothetical protein